MGPSTGTSGAVREFIRWMCRPGIAQQGLDPFTGNNYFNEITGALIGAGFTVLPLDRGIRTLRVPLRSADEP